MEAWAIGVDNARAALKALYARRAAGIFYPDDEIRELILLEKAWLLEGYLDMFRSYATDEELNCYFLKTYAKCASATESPKPGEPCSPEWIQREWAAYLRRGRGGRLGHSHHTAYPYPPSRPSDAPSGCNTTHPNRVGAPEDPAEGPSPPPEEGGSHPRRPSGPTPP